MSGFGIGSTGGRSPDVVLYDSNGNPIATHVNADGGVHLGTSIIQTILSSTLNYTDDNLASEASFTGTGEETFGINGIQTFHTADQDCTVYIDQSTDQTFADSTKTFTTSFDCLADVACARPVASVAPYYRLRVKNTDVSGVTTTKLETATGMAPIISTLPEELSPQGNLQVVASIRGDENYDRHLWVSPTSTAGVNTTVRLVGTNFDGTTKDTNFWTETVTGTGAVTQTGEIKLNTGITANSTAQYDSVRRARFVVGSALQFTGAYKFNDALVTGNIRRAGAYDDDQGFFFELAGTVFSVGSRKDTIDTLVASGSFNGNIGPHFTPNPALYYKLDIEWTPLGAFYYVNNSLLHKSLGGHLTRKLTLPIRFENNNTLGAVTDVTFDCLGVVISRLGELVTNPTYYYHALGTEAGVNLKVGAGVLHRILINNVVNNSVITISNGLTGVTDPIMVHTAGDSKATVSPIEIGAPFSTGLRLTVETQNASLTIVYE